MREGKTGGVLARVLAIKGHVWTKKPSLVTGTQAEPPACPSFLPEALFRPQCREKRPKPKHNVLSELRMQRPESGYHRDHRPGYHTGRISSEKEFHQSALEVSLSVWLNIELGMCRARLNRVFSE